MIKTILNRIPGLSRLGLTGGSELQRLLVKAASGSFTLKLTNTVLMFVISIILARLLGAAGFGAYSFALAWVNLLGVLATLGFGRLLVREISIYRDRFEWGLMRGLLARANQIVLCFSTAVALVAAFSAWIFAGDSGSEVTYTFWVAMALLPLTALTDVRQTAMQGLRKIVSGQVPEFAIRPILLLTSLCLFYLLAGDSLSAPIAMGLNSLSALLAFGVGAVLLWRSLPTTVKRGIPEYRTRIWLQGSLSLVIVSAMNIINYRIGTIMLGILAGPEATGLYTVALRGAELIMFILMAVSTSLGPVVSSLYAAGELDRLQRLITRASQLVLLVSVPVAAALILFGRWFLLIFGVEFTEGAAALAILSAGQLFSATMCAVGLLLMMTGHERNAAAGVGVGVALNVALSAVLIPRLGVEGAAVATATGTIVSNALLAVLVYKKLSIYPTALGRIGWRRAE